MLADHRDPEIVRQPHRQGRSSVQEVDVHGGIPCPNMFLIFRSLPSRPPRGSAPCTGPPCPRSAAPACCGASCPAAVLRGREAPLDVLPADPFTSLRRVGNSRNRLKRTIASATAAELPAGQGFHVLLHVPVLPVDAADHLFSCSGLAGSEEHRVVRVHQGARPAVTEQRRPAEAERWAPDVPRVMMA